MNLSLNQARVLLEDYAAHAQAIADIREATDLHSVPMDQLAGVIEDIISNLAVQNSLLAGDQPEPGPTVDETAQAVEQAYDDWAPEDTVVPATEPSCRGCLRLTEIDGRLMCGEARSRMYGGGVHWPGPGCVWASAGDAVYGGGRG